MPRTLRQWIEPAEHEDQSAPRAALRRAALRLVRHDPDKVEQADPAAALAESKRETWEVFVRCLMIGGLAFALGLIVLLAFIYSGHPYHS